MWCHVCINQSAQHLKSWKTVDSNILCSETSQFSHKNENENVVDHFVFSFSMMYRLHHKLSD